MDMPLPNYENPPVVEVAISAQFNTLDELTVPLLGLIWSEFKKEFPRTRDLAPLNPILEFFGPIPQPRKLEFQLDIKPQLPRCWFLNDDQTRLLQIQNDRFIHNWRKAQGQDYIRYKNIIKSFEEHYSKFETYLEREGIQKPVFNQCEITYVNAITTNEFWQTHNQLSELIKVYKPLTDDPFLPMIENAQITERYLIPGADGKPRGRLYVMVEPAFDPKTQEPVYLMKLIARGKPDGEDLSSFLAFCDIAREWIVRGFAALTTKKMSDDIWRRTDDKNL